jgi:hypothetical protein
MLHDEFDDIAVIYSVRPIGANRKKHHSSTVAIIKMAESSECSFRICYIVSYPFSLV